MSKRAKISIFLIIVSLISVIAVVKNYKPAIDRIQSSLTSGNSISGRRVADNDMNPIYSDIHHMSHNIVRADDKWGYKDLTLENIEKLIEKVKDADATKEVKDQALRILIRWQDGDFSSAHFDHNYVWGKLGGTVGRAKGVIAENFPDWAVE